MSFVLIFIFVIVVPLTVVNLYFNVLMIFWNKKILIIIKKKCKNRQAFVIVELVINVINVKYSADCGSTIDSRGSTRDTPPFRIG